MACNDHLMTVLERLLESQSSQACWVEHDSEFDNTSKRVMKELVDGQRDCLCAFSDWVRGLDFELPVSLVINESIPGNWHLRWDGRGVDEMTTHDMNMLDAMDCIVFHGTSRQESNPVLQDMETRGLPSRLRQNVSNA
ncbi:MAG: hypothetical protein P8L37_00690 [Phycisphaerales bacterium]|nr:hypothetical protein [Phycisphaerales bacterium]